MTESDVKPKEKVASQNWRELTQDRAEVLDHNARLYFELDVTGKGANLYSFYSEY